MNKKSFSYFVIGIAFFITSLFFCKSKSENPLSSPSTTQHDTLKIAGTYVYFANKAIYTGIMYIIVKDTLAFQSVDSLTQKKKWMKDTVFYTYQKSVDTTKPSLAVPVPKESVSLEIRVDSAIKILSQWINSHPQYFRAPVVAPPPKDTSATKKNK